MFADLGKEYTEVSPYYPKKLTSDMSLMLETVKSKILHGKKHLPEISKDVLEGI